MDMNEYQQKAYSFALPEAKSLNYLIPGMAAEVGEVAGKWAKAVRDNASYADCYAAELRKELGDVLWFVAVTADYMGVGLETLAHENIEKLTGRQKRGTLRGAGDNR